MKATPIFRADLEEYPELGKLVQASVRHIITVMEIHDIGSVRRFRKDGVFERPYAKDTVTPLGVPGVPNTVAAAREAAGSAILGYLEAIGIEGLTLEPTREEILSVAQLWHPQPQAPAPAPAPARDPKAQTVKKPQKQKTQAKPVKPVKPAPAPAAKQEGDK